MMRGFFSIAGHRYEAAVEFHSRVVDVLDWGSRVWADIPREKRGTIFDKTFIRGAKRNLINAIHEVSRCNAQLSFS